MGGESTVVSNIRRGAVRLVAWIAIYLIATALVLTYVPSLRPELSDIITSYSAYISVALTLAFGYMILRSFSNLIYWFLRLRHEHPTAASVRSLFNILGIGALVASIAGGVAGGAAGVALGGFIGMVVGFATQHALSQAISGLFVLLTRPIRIGDKITVAGETGVVEDISMMFTRVRKDDGTIALIPNNSIVGGKVYLHPKSKEGAEESTGK